MTIDKHIASLPEGRREAVQTVHDTVRAAAPELEATMWSYKIIAYGTYRGYLAEQNADRLGKVKVGKSCIRFKRVEDIDLDVVAELSRRAADLVAAGRFAM